MYSSDGPWTEVVAGEVFRKLINGKQCQVQRDGRGWKAFVDGVQQGAGWATEDVAMGVCEREAQKL